MVPLRLERPVCDREVRISLGTTTSIHAFFYNVLSHKKRLVERVGHNIALFKLTPSRGILLREAFISLYTFFNTFLNIASGV